jgi:catechol 2,3-dioxygenase-like lactoylglutathione lyase family enzyme
MLNSKDVVATIAVKDLQTARHFYEDKLDLTQAESDGENYISYESGETNVLVYQSKFAGGYKATVATWAVGDEIEDIVKTLKKRGVSFQHYDNLPGTKREGDIHMAEGMKMAWVADPDGNIICLVDTPSWRH